MKVCPGCGLSQAAEAFASANMARFYSCCWQCRDDAADRFAQLVPAVNAWWVAYATASLRKLGCQEAARCIEAGGPWPTLGEAYRMESEAKAVRALPRQRRAGEWASGVPRPAGLP